MLTQNQWLLVPVKSDVLRWEEEELSKVDARFKGITLNPAVFEDGLPLCCQVRGALWESRMEIWTS